MIKLRALKALPYNRIRMPGDVFEAKPGYAEFFVRAKLAERVTDEDAAEVPVTKAKRKYTKRALTATDYETVDLRAA